MSLQNPGLVRNTKIRVFLYGIIVSFAGSLPLGSFNVVTVSIAFAHGYGKAFLFAVGGLVAEILYVCISVVLVNRIMQFRVFMKLVQWISLSILVIFAVVSFAAAIVNIPAQDNLIADIRLPFVAGFIMMAVNPAQIPFWFGWTAVLFERQLLAPNSLTYSLYIAGAGFGSLLASVLFIIGGQYLSEWNPMTQQIFQFFMGVIFSVTAMMQGVRMVKERSKGKISG